MGFSTFDAALLDCAGRSFQIISLLIAGVVTVYFKNTRMLMVTIGNVICVIATALLSFLPTANHWGRLISFWFINVQSVGKKLVSICTSVSEAGLTRLGAGFTLGLVMVSSNIGTPCSRIAPLPYFY